MHPVDRARVAGAIETAHRNHHVDPVLVLAVIRQESHFRADARGAGNSIGLMQVRPFVAADVARRHNIPWAGAKTLLDPGRERADRRLLPGRDARDVPRPGARDRGLQHGPDARAPDWSRAGGLRSRPTWTRC